MSMRKFDVKPFLDEWKIERLSVVSDEKIIVEDLILKIPKVLAIDVCLELLPIPQADRCDLSSTRGTSPQTIPAHRQDIVGRELHEVSGRMD